MTVAAGAGSDARPLVTVLTVTRDRPNLLRRAIASVRRQDLGAPVEHLVISDDDPTVVDTVASEPSTPERQLRAERIPLPAQVVRRPGDRTFVYPRLASLLNEGIRRARGEWIAFLDDDNEFEPEHLRTLLEVARGQGLRAVHSARQMVQADGAPYLRPIFPGAPTEDEGRRIYELMCGRGVWVRGTNILRDRVDPGPHTYTNSTVMGSDDPVFLVDQNLWLIEARLLADVPVPENFTALDLELNTCPDDKLLQALVEHGIEIGRSDLPSVRYYLGGISNGDEQPAKDGVRNAEEGPRLTDKANPLARTDNAVEREVPVEIDHRTVAPPFIRLARAERWGGHEVRVWDLRLGQPNVSYLDGPALHSLEHLVTVLARQRSDQAVHAAPMGCQTGLYLVTVGAMTFDEVAHLVAGVLEDVGTATEVPLANEVECGWAEHHTLVGAQRVAAWMLDRREQWSKVSAR